MRHEPIKLGTVKMPLPSHYSPQVNLKTAKAYHQYFSYILNQTFNKINVSEIRDGEDL